MAKNVIIPNPDDLEKKKDLMKKAGKSSLHIISDFDRCLTKAFIDGKKIPTTLAKIREGNYLSSEYVKKAYELYDIYRPIEISNKIPEKERDEKMVEWWQKHLEIMIEYGMNKNVIKDIIKDSKIVLRNGASEFFNLLAKEGIPLIIFSAGLGDLIQEFLKKDNKMQKNIHIVSNFYKFDKNGKVTGYKSKVIHTFNKNEIDIKDKTIENRKNVILLGDNLGDLGMLKGLDYDILIKICFLNQETKNLLEDFKKHFDVIILNDGPMDFVNTLIKEII